MMRPATRKTSRCALLAVVSLAAAAAAIAACGIDEALPPEDAADGSLPDGTVVGPDGEIITPNDDAALPDGALPDGALSDGGTDADASLDAKADADADSSVAVDSGPLVTTYVDYKINHILVAGQSNSVASGSNSPLSATQPFTNIKFDTGLMSMNGSPSGAAGDQCDGNGCTKYQIPAAFSPLISNEGFFGAATETIAPGMANQISHLATTQYQFGVRPGYPTTHDVLSSVHGRSGNEYVCLRKGGCQYMRDRGASLEPFAQGTMFTAGPYINHGEVKDGKLIADALAKSYVVRAVAVVHGESDHYAYTLSPNYDHPSFPAVGTNGVAGKVKDYADALVEWQEDYAATIKGITGQTQDVLLLVSGVSGWTASAATLPFSPLANMQLAAHVAAPGKVVYVTPGYPFFPLNDCNHYTNHGMRRLGEYFGKVYARVVFGGEVWEPVRPKTITRAAAVIDVEFYVPNPPLAFDTTRVVATPNMGFDFYDNGVKATISSVVLMGTKGVRITLAAAPSGVNMRLKYAQNELPAGTGCIGPGITFARGAAGNLRDSDTTPSYYTDGAGVPYPMHNWSAHFDQPVP